MECDRSSYQIQADQQAELNKILATISSDLPADQHRSLTRRLDELLSAIESQTFKRFGFLR